jgi:hypothetical protein
MRAGRTLPAPAARGGRRAAPRGPLAWLAAGTAAALTLWLVPFHIWLLWERLSDLSIGQPIVALRWLGAVALVAAGIREARQGRSLLRGRRALALWTLAFLLHAGATPVQGHPLPLSAPPPPAIHLLWLVPLALAGGLPELAEHLAAALRRRDSGARPTRYWESAEGRPLPNTPGQRPELGAPRPPPFLSAALASA